MREAAVGDFAAITGIYAHEVAERTATFELVAPDEAEMRARHAAVTARGLPWIVAEVSGQVVGYAYAGPFRVRPAYDLTAEDSIYLAPEWQRRGIGRRLLERLIADCTGVGCRQMLALIGDSSNTGSIALHAALGFRHAGLLTAAGLKFGRWLDVVVMQRALGVGDADVPAGGAVLGRKPDRVVPRG
ncbi:GNAT family N-acetyltransferase [Opitutales bacterium ASA1]|nr:GNAT family N-acetyltransferase [Opitutales bacterium ASA1]